MGFLQLVIHIWTSGFTVLSSTLLNLRYFGAKFEISVVNSDFAQELMMIRSKFVNRNRLTLSYY